MTLELHGTPVGVTCLPFSLRDLPHRHHHPEPWSVPEGWEAKGARASRYRYDLTPSCSDGFPKDHYPNPAHVHILGNSSLITESPLRTNEFHGESAFISPIGS